MISPTQANLILIPTPIAEDLPIEAIAHQWLLQDCMKSDVGILVEEHKVGRKRWLSWGLPREAIDQFIVFNEHSQADLSPKLISEMKNGKRFYLMSDAGLPAFCDPGQKLVDEVHRAKLTVTASPFPNSIALALSLSGFTHQEFYFAGFLPANSDERRIALERISRIPQTLILMDTPYRMQALLKDIEISSLRKRMAFLATDLNQSSELLIRGPVSELAIRAAELGKKEFILILERA